MAKTVDLTKITYYVTAVHPDGRLMHLEGVAENIAWEENESEVATRLNLTLRDIPFEDSRLSKKLALCTAVYLYAKWDDSGKQEIFRGTIWEWEHSQTNDDAIVVTCYDLLYYLQKSQDSMYWPKGRNTSDICKDILEAWGVPLSEYSGPSITHEKTLYKNKAISAMLTETLDAAKKKTGEVGIIRAVEGECQILTRGENSEVWDFTADTNLVSASDKYTMADLVTRVILVGKDDKNGRPKVEATVDGKTEYGILQTVKSIGSTKLADAKKEAEELIEEKGKPKRTITFVAPEFPAVRKGDVIHAKTNKLIGYFYVKGVSHNATSKSMQMEVEPYE